MNVENFLYKFDSFQFFDVSKTFEEFSEFVKQLLNDYGLWDGIVVPIDHDNCSSFDLPSKRELGEMFNQLKFKASIKAGSREASILEKRGVIKDEGGKLRFLPLVPDSW